MLTRLSTGFAAAAGRSAPAIHDVLLGDRRVRFQIVGEALAKRLRLAFAHLTADFTAPDLTVALWDETATGEARPVGDVRGAFEDHEAFGDGVYARDGEAGLICYQTPRQTMILDKAAGVIVGCAISAEALSFYEVGKPIQPLLFSWLVAENVAPLHAALVSVEGRGLLLGGQGGSGKSTTSLTCARAGFDFLGDDYIGLTRGEDGAIGGHSFYASAWLEAEHSRRLAWIGEHRLPGNDAGEPKVSFSVTDSLPGALTRTTTVVAIGLPHVVRGQTETLVTPIAKGEALRRLAVNAVLQLPFLDPKVVLGRTAELVRVADCYDIALGADIEAIPATLRRQILERRPASIAP